MSERIRSVKTTVIRGSGAPEQVRRNGPVVLSEQEMERRDRIAKRRAQSEAERVTVMLKFAHKQWKSREKP